MLGMTMMQQGCLPIVVILTFPKFSCLSLVSLAVRAHPPALARSTQSMRKSKKNRHRRRRVGAAVKVNKLYDIPLLFRCSFTAFSSPLTKLHFLHIALFRGRAPIRMRILPQRVAKAMGVVRKLKETTRYVASCMVILASLVCLSDQGTTADTRSPQIPTSETGGTSAGGMFLCILLHLSFGIATGSPSLSTDGPLHECLQRHPFPGPGG